MARIALPRITSRLRGWPAARSGRERGHPPEVTAEAELGRLIGSWLAGFSAATAADYRRDLSDLLAFCALSRTPVLTLQRAQLRHYARFLADQRGLAPATVARRLVTACGLLRHAVDLQMLADDPTAGFRRPPVPLRRRPLRLLPDQIGPLLRAADGHSARAGALLSLAVLSGPRVSELVSADVPDLQALGDGRLAWQLRRKGGAVDVLVLAEHTRVRLQGWLDGRAQGPVFTSRTGRRLQRAAVGELLRTVAAGCLPPTQASAITAHDVRRAHAVACVTAGVPLVVLQAGLGHSTPRTVLRYAFEAAELEGHSATAQLERHVFG